MTAPQLFITQFPPNDEVGLGNIERSQRVNPSNMTIRWLFSHLIINNTIYLETISSMLQQGTRILNSDLTLDIIYVFSWPRKGQALWIQI